MRNFLSVQWPRLTHGQTVTAADLGSLGVVAAEQNPPTCRVTMLDGTHVTGVVNSASEMHVSLLVGSKENELRQLQVSDVRRVEIEEARPGRQWAVVLALATAWLGGAIATMAGAWGPGDGMATLVFFVAPTAIAFLIQVTPMRQWFMRWRVVHEQSVTLESTG